MRGLLRASVIAAASRLPHDTPRNISTRLGTVSTLSERLPFMCGHQAA